MLVLVVALVLVIAFVVVEEGSREMISRMVSVFVLVSLHHCILLLRLFRPFPVPRRFPPFFLKKKRRALWCNSVGVKFCDSK